MFNFDEDKLTTEQVINIAERNGLSPIRVAINANGYRGSQQFWGAIDISNVYKGDDLAVIIKHLEGLIKSGRYMITVRNLYENIRKVKPFVTREIRLHQRLHYELIPQLEKMNLVCPIRNKIYINPALADWGWNPEFKVYEVEHSSRLPYHLRYSEEEVEAAMEFYRKAKLLLNGK